MAHLKLRVQVCLEDVNSKGNARDPGCVMRNRIAAYLYSKEASEKPTPPVSLPFSLCDCPLVPFSPQDN